MSRGTTVAKGYGGNHQALRKAWIPRVAAGGVRCGRGADCQYVDEDGLGGLITPGEPWDLGHDDFDRSVYTGPEHRICNRATAGRAKTSRDW